MRGYIYNYCSRMEWMREDRATMWVRMPDFKAPFTALALVLAEQTPMMLGHCFNNYCSRMEWMREDRATMWVRMPDFKAPFTALALVLAEQTPMMLGHCFKVSRGT